MFYLIAPWLVVFLFGLSILLVALKKWKLGVPILVVGICLNFYTEAVPFNLFSTHDDGNLKIMCYNIDSSNNFKEDTALVDSMAQMILKENADVLVLEEYSDQYCGRLDSLLCKRYSFREILSSGCPNAVYSKYPLSNKMELELDSTSVMNEGLEQAAKIDSVRTMINKRQVMGLTFKKGKKRLRLIACHLASNQYNMTRRNMPTTEKWWKGIPQYRLGFLSGGLARETETQYIQQEVEKYKKQGLPVIVCGDMNDVSGSKTLSILLSAGLKNAWWEKGRGFGFTYHGHYIMNFRIDHILHTEDIEVKSIKKIEQSFSDHDPVIASFTWM